MINITTNVIYMDMPTTIKAYTVNNKDNSFTIILNSRLNREQHLKSYHHELTHIERGDYDSQFMDADIIEINAHKYAHNILE